MDMSTRGEETLRTYEEVNRKIVSGDAVVMTADEFVELVRAGGIEAAAKEVDVVTTGTFGAMCSSGAFLNIGHTEPPIRLNECFLNDVPCYTGLAAVDIFVGATAMSRTRGIEYGGGHVIEDLVAGREVELKAEGRGTDCYPRRYLETTISLEEINQAVLLNPRNAYERYNGATNSSDRLLHTYMGTLLPKLGNITYSGSGQLSPLYKDRGFETLGIGTRIFLAGAAGYIVGEGTQHHPQKQLGTLMVRGDLKEMDPLYLKGASIQDYGPSLYVGLGVPLPIINLRVAKTAATPDEEIKTEIKDYGIASSARPSLRTVTYAELKSGRVNLNGRDVPASPMSSHKHAKEIAEELKGRIKKGRFLLSRPAELLPIERPLKLLRTKNSHTVGDIMNANFATAGPRCDISRAATLIVQSGIDHLPIVDEGGRLIGIVTSWDIAKAVATGKQHLRSIMTTSVVSFSKEDSVDEAANRLLTNHISGAPVVDRENKVVGLITIEDLTKLYGRRGAR